MGMIGKGQSFDVFNKPDAKVNNNGTLIIKCDESL